jgi:hypothetical protein
MAMAARKPNSITDQNHGRPELAYGGSHLLIADTMTRTAAASVAALRHRAAGVVGNAVVTRRADRMTRDVVEARR